MQAPPGPPGHDERRWLLGLAIVTCCSWARCLATGSPKVDGNYPSQAIGTVLFVVLLVGWSLALVGWRGLLARPPASPRRLAFVGLFVAALMLPMTSNDVFSLLAYGSVAARGHDVYTTVEWLPRSVWFPWVGDLWAHTVCVYGPTVLLSAVPAALAGGNPWLALLVLRATWLVPLALVMELSFRELRDRPFFHAFVWLNPLWLVDGPGQLHADVLGTTAIAAGILLCRRGRIARGWAAYGFAVLGKYTFAFAGAWFWLFGARNRWQLARRLPAMAGILLALGVVFYAPFWRGPATLTEPIRALAEMNPGGSVVEAVGEISYAVRARRIDDPSLPAPVLAARNRAAKSSAWRIAALVMRLVALGVGLRVLAAMLRLPQTVERISLGAGTVVVAAVTLFSHRFQSWYLMAALPFFGLGCTNAWKRWWTAAVAVTVSVEFVHVLPKDATLMVIWSVLASLAQVVLFFVSFRARYLTFDEREELIAGGGARSAAIEPAGT